MALTDLGIDPRVAAVLEANGIRDLYPPQKEAWKAIRGGRNTVVAIPTASGKSLVAYLAMLHRWLATGKKSLYIVPLRALASEKAEELQQFKPLGLTVGLSTGDLDDKDPKLGRFDIIVCTSEKADALLRHRTGWMDDIGCVVADEVHLLNDAGRGPTLEVILTRFRSILPQAQLVGLSATVANSKAIADWLDAALVQSDWRPVTLKVGTYFGDNLHFLGSPPRKLEAGGDPVVSLVEDVIRDGGQSLVFVSTRKSAEAQATKLAPAVRAMLSATELAALEQHASGLDDGGEGSPTAKKLNKLVKAGVAYHTAGLDSSQRRLIEDGFRKGRIKVLCATPTLAAGVNTPARRVIIRDLARFEMGEGNRPLPVMEVKQMMGRAGRPRYDPYGEAVLLVKSAEQKEQVEDEYLRGPPEAVESKLSADAALRIHVLASVAGGYATSLDELARFFSKTFWAQETSDWIVRDRLDDTVQFLETNGFLEPTYPGSKEGRVKATLFGKRTSDLYVDPFSALRIKVALSSKYEPTAFGLLEAVCGCPDLFPLYLRQSDAWVQQRFWDHHEEILVPEDGKDLEAAMSYAKTAFLLMDWMQEVHMDTLEERYQVGPGDVRMRLDNGQWLLHAFQELARAMRPEWVKPLQDLGLRLQHGVKEELLPLIRLRGVGRIRARALRAAGFAKPADLKGVPVSRLSLLPGIGDKLAFDLLRQVGDDVQEPAAAPPMAPLETGTAAQPSAPAKAKRSGKATKAAPPPPPVAPAGPEPAAKKGKGQASMFDFKDE
ncbi:MAG TPA: DEAD/DEAH box helicase [Candidatus Thermoplasmatota archaeon]|nr:DEAD/DEAH box helicase [Candidatus Thermoplasmatota archaeon]